MSNNPKSCPINERLDHMEKLLEKIQEDTNSLRSCHSGLGGILIGFIARCEGFMFFMKLTVILVLGGVAVYGLTLWADGRLPVNIKIYGPKEGGDGNQQCQGGKNKSDLLSPITPSLKMK